MYVQYVFDNFVSIHCILLSIDKNTIHSSCNCTRWSQVLSSSLCVTELYQVTLMSHVTPHTKIGQTNNMVTGDFFVNILIIIQSINYFKPCFMHFFIFHCDTYRACFIFHFLSFSFFWNLHCCVYHYIKIEKYLAWNKTKSLVFHVMKVWKAAVDQW